VSQRPQEVLYQPGIQITHLAAAKSNIHHSVAPPTDIHRHQGQGIVHRHQAMGHPDYTPPLSQSLAQRPPQANGHILHQMMLVSTCRQDLEVKNTMLGKLIQEMIKESDTRPGLALPTAVNVKLYLNAGLTGLPFHLGQAFSHVGPPTIP
jgi:hypothetical protein